ncbi:hypothetical protein [Streptomyces sp. B5E4]|uniref:hypothetical protein n=1 Tax=Streptomyces sp. B5E4 TaxID=3153568 RepID=UPI00325C7C78
MSLPNVIDTRSLRAHREVEAMREVWERGRGAEWAPRPEVAAAARAEAGASERNQNWLVEVMGEAAPRSARWSRRRTAWSGRRRTPRKWRGWPIQGVRTRRKVFRPAPGPAIGQEDESSGASGWPLAPEDEVEQKG